MKVQYSVIIKRPVEEVFAYVSNLQNEVQWQPEIKEVTILSDGKLQTGSKFREVRTTMGRKLEWLFDITSLVPNKEVCIKSYAGAAPYSGCRSFEAVEGGTRVTETGEMILTGVFKLMEPLLIGPSVKRLEVAYQRLKGILEG